MIISSCIMPKTFVASNLLKVYGLVLQCLGLEGPAVERLEWAVDLDLLGRLLMPPDLEGPSMLAVHLVVHDARGREPAAKGHARGESRLVSLIMAPLEPKRHRTELKQPSQAAFRRQLRPWLSSLVASSAFEARLRREVQERPLFACKPAVCS